MLRGSSGSPDILISFRRSDGRFEMPPGGLFLGWVYISFQFSLADIPSRTFPRPGVRPSAGTTFFLLFRAVTGVTAQ